MKCLAKKRPLFCGLGCPRFSFHPMAGLSTGGKNQTISDRVQRHSKHCGMARSNQNYFRRTESRKCLKGHKGPVKNPSFLHLLLLLTLPMPETTMQLHPFSFKATIFFFFFFFQYRETLSWLWRQLLAEATIVDLEMQERLKLLCSQPSV